MLPTDANHEPIINYSLGKTRPKRNESRSISHHLMSFLEHKLDFCHHSFYFRDTERMRKVKEIEHLLSSQQGEVNEMKRIKRKLGKIP